MNCDKKRNAKFDLKKILDKYPDLLKAKDTKLLISLGVYIGEQPIR